MKKSFFRPLIDALFFLSSAMITSVRITARDTFKINGNPVEDFFAALLFYPGVAVQLDAAADDAERSATPPLEAVVPSSPSGNNNPAYVPDIREVSKL